MELDPPTTTDRIEPSSRGRYFELGINRPNQQWFSLNSKSRLRHLWRMCFGVFVVRVPFTAKSCAAENV
jgi:hypothetical protein